MSKSAAFIRIKNDILKIVTSIPTGKVCSYRSIGNYLDVMPRHVAYILAMLDDSEKTSCPWQRVVGEKGVFGTSKRTGIALSQAILLESEGHEVRANTSICDFEESFVEASDLASGVQRQSRTDLTPS